MVTGGVGGSVIVITCPPLYQAPPAIPLLMAGGAVAPYPAVLDEPRAAPVSRATNPEPWDDDRARTAASTSADMCIAACLRGGGMCTRIPGMCSRPGEMCRAGGMCRRRGEMW